MIVIAGTCACKVLLVVVLVDFARLMVVRDCVDRIISIACIPLFIPLFIANAQWVKDSRSDVNLQNHSLTYSPVVMYL